MKDDPAFRDWLTLRSWRHSVRYCGVLALLMLPASIASNLPLLRGDWAHATLAQKFVLAWQLCVELTCVGMLLADRFMGKRGRELRLYVFCGLFVALATWTGVRGALLGGSGLILYAAGLTFLSALIGTPLPVRRPMYLASLIVLAVPLWLHAADASAFVASLVAPCSVVILCLELDRATYARSAELFTERQKAEAERARADKVLYNVLPASVADELKRSERVNAQKFENMGVLFADIVGFTSFSRALPPDALVLVLNQIFSAFDALVDRFGLEKIKTIGDAYMVVAHQHLDEHLVALGELAQEMVRAIDRYNRDNGTALNMRIGIHAGPAVAGVIGVKRFLYDVWGDTVNVASRMESSGEPGAIHVSDAVHAQTRHRFTFEAREPLEIKGRGRMSTYWLRGPAIAAAEAMAQAAPPAARAAALAEPLPV